MTDRGYVTSAPFTGLTSGICYYTDNLCPETLFSIAQEQLKRAAGDRDIVSVSLKPLQFGDNYVLALKRGYVSMFQQILMGLSMLQTDFAFLTEHDCLYPSEHFQFVPPGRDKVFYNENIWMVHYETGHALFRYRKSVLALCADRRLLIDHYRERLARIEHDGFSFLMGFEPGTKQRSHGGIDDLRSERWFSAIPIIDFRNTGANNTKTLWSKEEFRNPKYTEGWTESQAVPGWGVTEGRMPEFLNDITT